MADPGHGRQHHRAADLDAADARERQDRPSAYAKAKAAGLRIITWSLERSGPLSLGGGYYTSRSPRR